VLNGEKMWITNSGFADLFTVFAKIDGEKFSAFLIERDTPGFSSAEEHKLGIRGSSTCPLILADCQVPVENLLGECRQGPSHRVQHSEYRPLQAGRGLRGRRAQQPGRRHRLRQGAQGVRQSHRRIRPDPGEAGGMRGRNLRRRIMVYRTIGMIDAALADVDASAEGASREIQKRIEEYAVECSILKVWGSEMLDMVVDHVVQIYAGYGYVEEYPAERAYRDSRINRIFEGTNEINRLIITGWLMKRAVAGQLPLLAAIKKLMDEVMAGPSASEEREGPLAAEHKMLARRQETALFAAGAASQKYMQGWPISRRSWARWPIASWKCTRWNPACCARKN
jgi:hypothetical protein